VINVLLLLLKIKRPFIHLGVIKMPVLFSFYEFCPVPKKYPVFSLISARQLILCNFNQQPEIL